MNQWLTRFASISLLAVLWIQIPFVALANDAQFDELKIGAQVYKNVTVTTRNKDYVFLAHSGGLVNLKVATLSPEDRLKLGYSPEGEKKNNWTAQTLAEAPVKEVKAIKEDLSILAQDAGLTVPEVKLDWALIAGLIAASLLFYLFWSYCSFLICQKAGKPGGILVWVPVLQLIPLLRAAGMSGWWFLGFCLPVLNLVGQILWSIRISQARGKGVVCTVFLLLPVTNFFAFLYLAFSSSAKVSVGPARSQRIQLAGLQPA